MWCVGHGWNIIILWNSIEGIMCTIHWMRFKFAQRNTLWWKEHDGNDRKKTKQKQSTGIEDFSFNFLSWTSDSVEIRITIYWLMRLEVISHNIWRSERDAKRCDVFFSINSSLANILSESLFLFCFFHRHSVTF